MKTATFKFDDDQVAKNMTSVEEYAKKFEAGIRADERRRIREVLLSDVAKNASARMMQELSAQGVGDNRVLAYEGMKAALAALGLTEEEGES